MQQFSTNPNPKYAKGLSTGFQRQQFTVEQPQERDMLRLGFSGTSSQVRYEPVQKASIHPFLADAVTVHVQFAAINRNGTDPVLIHYSPYQRHSVAMVAEGQGTSFQQDDVVGVLTPNQGQTFYPNYTSAGAQIAMTTVVGQQQTITLTDLQGRLLTDVSSFYISLCFFERPADKLHP